jgi:hypothetical protein
MPQLGRPTGLGSVSATIRRRNNGPAQINRLRAAEVNGRFVRRYQLLSLELQRMTVAEIEPTLVRRTASSGRLEAVTASRRNREVTNEGFTVGIPSFLETSQAKYALAVNFGTRAHIGRRITGVWIEGGQFRRFGSPASNGIFRTTRYTTAINLTRGEGGEVVGMIKEPISAHNYYKTAWDKFDIRKRMLEVVRQELARP